MITYARLRTTTTPEIKELARLFCEESGADQEAQEIIIQRLPEMHIFVALDSGAIAAIIGYYIISNNKAIFDFLYVKPDYRNHSLAGRIYHMAKGYAKAMGAETIIIYTKPATAKRWLKLGYEEKFKVLEQRI